MAKKKLRQFKVKDTVTYERSWIVWAKNEDDALMKALSEGPVDDATYEKEQIDNTPYEVEPWE
jgi:hypothetical protein